jgi:hypothetical protein
MAVGSLGQKRSVARRLQDVHFSTRIRLRDAGHSPTAVAYWMFSGTSQVSRAADEVIEYGTRTSAFGTRRTCCRSRLMSVAGGRTDLARTRPDRGDRIIHEHRCHISWHERGTLTQLDPGEWPANEEIGDDQDEHQKKREPFCAGPGDNSEEKRLCSSGRPTTSSRIGTTPGGAK